MRFSNIQNRIAEQSVVTGADILFQNKIYQLGKPVPRTLHTSAGAIALLSDGYVTQFELMQEGQVVGEAWFYCYHSHEGKFWAVMDEVELYDKEDLK